MKIVSSTQAVLEAGETIPVFCPCGQVYQPELDSEISDCPSCDRPNVHGMTNVVRVEE